MTDLRNRVARLEAAEVAARPPEPRRVILAERIGEDEAEARTREGVPAGERCIFVEVADASRRA